MWCLNGRSKDGCRSVNAVEGVLPTFCISGHRRLGRSGDDRVSLFNNKVLIMSKAVYVDLFLQMAGYVE